MYPYYLGVDLHSKRTYVVLMDQEGKVQDQQRLLNQDVGEYVAKLPANTCAVLEATGNWSYLYEVLTAKLAEVQLAHPKQVRAIAAARIKTDRIDATILAHLARTNLLPTAYAAPLPIRELRDITRHRSKLVRERTRHKNRIHRLLSRYNVHSPCTDLFGKRGRQFLRDTLPNLSLLHQQMIGNYLGMIDSLNEPIKQADAFIKQWACGAAEKLDRIKPGLREYSVLPAPMPQTPPV